MQSFDGGEVSAIVTTELIDDMLRVIQLHISRLAPEEGDVVACSAAASVFAFLTACQLGKDSTPERVLEQIRESPWPACVALALHRLSRVDT